MVTSYQGRRRRGAVVVEFAIVAPVMLFIVFAEIIGGLAISRHQEIAHLARDCARFASTHGGDYQQDGIATKTGVPSVLTSDHLRSYLANKVVLLNLDQLQIDLSWTSPTNLTPRNMPTYVDTDPNQVPPGQIVIRNNVIVTLKYDWMPETNFLGIGPITLTSTSEMPMSY